MAEAALKTMPAVSSDVTSTPFVFKDELLASVPSLRAFALSLTYNGDRADDLVQETLVRAWANRETYRPDTHLKAWLFTILRNQFYTECRKRQREVEDADGSYAERLVTMPDQTKHIDFVRFREAMKLLPNDQREVLLLVGASGFSYEEAAEICHVAVGTVKSRINRGRAKLAEILGMSSPSDHADDDTMLAAISGPMSSHRMVE